jgi:hypothetical protein
LFESTDEQQTQPGNGSQLAAEPPIQVIQDVTAETKGTEGQGREDKRRKVN